jgi:single-stranded-DNA-specific exonuclease
MDLPDMPRAVKRVERAVTDGETILVHGDYDADGMSASALLALGLSRLGARVETFVPHRTRDGYDLSEAGVRRARDLGSTLIVTADCGVTAVQAVASAAESGIDVVVTDHHRPGHKLPDAAAVVDPLRDDSQYPFPGLAGVGVVFKLMSALYERAGLSEPELNQHLDLVAIGTVSDQMPLLGENRILVRSGLRALARTRKPGLRALLGRTGVSQGQEVEAEHISFRLGPRLNSVGRMAEAEAGFRLLVTEDPAEAQRLAVHMDRQNAQRRAADSKVYSEVEGRLAAQFDEQRDRAVVLWGDGWHPGVIGIVASRLVERLHRPAVVVTFDGEVGRGSGRSVDGFHLYEALQECEPLLDRFGGHRMAAGLSIRRAKVEEFAASLRELADRSLSDSDLVHELRLDLELTLRRAQRELHGWLGHLAPFGAANPSPVLMVRSVQVSRPKQVGTDGDHLRAELVDGEIRLPAIGFGLGRRLAEALEHDKVDVAFELSENRWNGRRQLQARVLDFRPAE